jgi:hypothetical protein
MLEPEPKEMTESNYEKFGFGAMVKRVNLEGVYPLLDDLNAALAKNAGHPVYNPNSHTIHAFSWANVNYGATQQLCVCSNTTGKVLASDVTGVPDPENLFQGYMVELVNLSKL